MARAILCHGFGPLENLSFEDIEVRAPGSGEVAIAVEAIGVNYPDALLVQELYQMKPPTPFVPGMEVAGTVKAVGADVSDFSAGDRVAALMQYGGYASEVVVDRRTLLPLPPSIDAGDACALLCAYGTAHHALKQRAVLKPGETLVVLGAAGSTGIAAVQIGKAMGARVIAVALTAAKQELAQANGADVTLGYGDLKAVLKEATGGRGADVVFDPVGGDAFDAASRSMARGGRLLVIGFASGRIPNFPVNLALVKEFSVVGVFWGAFTAKEPAVYADNMRELIGWHAEGAVRPHIEGWYDLADAARVLRRIIDRGTVGKVLLRP